MILYALDPHEKDVERVKALQSWIGHGKVDEEMFVSVLSPLDFGATQSFPVKAREALLKLGEAGLERFLKEAELQGIPATTLYSRTPSLRDSVKTLLEFARRKKASLVCVNSHTNSQTQWTGLGSFAENLVSSSSIPVMVLGRKAHVPEQLKKILIPSDFSPESKKVYLKALDWAKARGAKVLLYHQTSPMTAPLAYGAYGLALDTRWLEELWKEERAEAKKTAEKWKKWADRKKVSVEVCVDSEPSDFATRVCEMAQEDSCDLIIASVRRGPLRQALFGRRLRALLSESCVPLLVWRSF